MSHSSCRIRENVGKGEPGFGCAHQRSRYCEPYVRLRDLPGVSGGKMDKVSWQFFRINWTLYRDTSEGLWMAFSSNSDSYRTTEKTNMESWLADRGLRTEDIAKLFRQAEKTGEAAVTVSRLHESPNS